MGLQRTLFCTSVSSGRQNITMYNTDADGSGTTQSHLQKTFVSAVASLQDAAPPNVHGGYEQGDWYQPGQHLQSNETAVEDRRHHF